MAIEEAGANPQLMAEAIHGQLGNLSGAVPVCAIALALDIHEIREKWLTSFEGALITTAEKGFGSILVNKHSSPQRRRFTVAHELHHFLNPYHRPTAGTGFECLREDMIVTAKDTWYLRQEAEANSFAIELLTPRKRVETFLNAPADLQLVVEIASEFDISKEAATRRYVTLHDECLAVAFSRENRFLYSAPAPTFPKLRLFKGDAMPQLPGGSGRSVSEVEEADPGDWLMDPAGWTLSVQTLVQERGYATSLLIGTEPGVNDPLELEDTYERFSKLSDR